MHIKSRLVARGLKKVETPPLAAYKAIISIAANHKHTFSIMHVDVPRKNSEGCAGVLDCG